MELGVSPSATIDIPAHKTHPPTDRPTKNDSANPGFGRICLGKRKMSLKSNPDVSTVFGGGGEIESALPRRATLTFSRDCPQGAFTFNFYRRGSGLCVPYLVQLVRKIRWQTKVLYARLPAEKKVESLWGNLRDGTTV